MKKMLIVVAVLVVVGGGVYIAFGRQRLGAPGAKGPTSAPTIAPVEAGEEVVAEGKVVPLREATLALQTGGTVAEVLAAEGDLVQAGRPLVRLDAAQARAALAQAQAALARAQAHLDELKAGPRAQEVAIAQATLAAAQASLLRLQEGVDENQIIAAKAEAANAEAALKLAQAAYDRVGALPGVSARPESLKLEQATNNYRAAKGRLDALRAGPSPAEIAVAQAEIRRAQAQLELTQAGARPEAIAAAEADVAAAKATLEEAQAALGEMELRAPFAGTVATLDAQVGEPVAAGAPIVRLADLSAWQIETTDLTELNIARVRVGAPATITFDALPGLELKGKVERIRPYGEAKQGDIVYTVVVKPEAQDARLRWNMTASVSIEAQ